MLQAWLNQFARKIQADFTGRVDFIGIQGSVGRGEATAQSDIDVVVILDQFSYADLKHYDQAISELPCREKICGFISGREELKHWDRGDLFQFYYDTAPLYGDLEWLRPLIRQEDILRAIHLGSCNIYHGCVHNAIHEKSLELLHSLLKSAVFVLQAKQYEKTGIYYKKRSGLRTALTGMDAQILQWALQGVHPEEFDMASEQLMTWAHGGVHCAL